MKMSAEYFRKWRKMRSPDDRRRVNDYKKEYRAKNPSYHRAYVKRWKRDNPDANREIARAGTERRRMRECGGGGRGLTSRQWRNIMAEYDNRCAYCFRVLKLEMDHINPLSAGGDHDPANIAPACRNCNSSKHDHSLVIWLASYGRPLDLLQKEA